jgi:hypothetical protein
MALSERPAGNPADIEKKLLDIKSMPQWNKVKQFAQRILDKDYDANQLYDWKVEDVAKCIGAREFWATIVNRIDNAEKTLTFEK